MSLLFHNYNAMWDYTLTLYFIINILLLQFHFSLNYNRFLFFFQVRYSSARKISLSKCLLNPIPIHKCKRIFLIFFYCMMWWFLTIASLGEFNLIKIAFQRKIPFYFLLPISRESIVFGSDFRNRDFDGFTRFEVPWIRKTHF